MGGAKRTTNVLPYVCPKCKGSASVVGGRVKVDHKEGCARLEYLATTFPKLYRFAKPKTVNCGGWNSRRKWS